MGLSPFSGSSFSSYDSPAPVRGNPDPKKFKIIDATEVKGFLVLAVKYEDATNYEGKKVLLYDHGVTVAQLVAQGSIDPHFSESKEKISPMARFEPTVRGHTMAVLLCDVLSRLRGGDK